MRHLGAPGSLRWRLLGATLVTLTLALTGAYVWLARQFHDHGLRQFDTGLTQQLDQLTARLVIDVQGRPWIDPRSLSDPRWDRPYAGLYWQLDRLDADGRTRAGVLRSRSLWDATLVLEVDALADGERHFHALPGPRGESLRVVEHALRLADPDPGRWRLMVAGDTREVQEAVARFQGGLAASLGGLGLLLALAAWAQVAVGLAPLNALQRALQRLREGQTSRLEGRFPHELQPLVDDLNGVLDRHAEGLARARTQAGNLAHALKTPLAVLGRAAQQAPDATWAAGVAEQVEAAQRQVRWHLARARAAATPHLPGQRTPLLPLLDGLLRVMNKLHAERHLRLDVELPAAELAFAGEAQDLQEMVGNLLDNACRSARTEVRIMARRDGSWLHLRVSDDGPGIAPEQRHAARQRGVRLDESLPGSGLGLAIVEELATLYGGHLALQGREPTGLCAVLTLPAAG